MLTSTAFNTLTVPLESTTLLTVTVPTPVAAFEVVLFVSATSVLVSVPVATLTSGSWVNESGANIVFNNFLVPLVAGTGVTLTQAGSTCTTMTSLNYRVMYLSGDRI